jgi:hypothetical protein
MLQGVPFGLGGLAHSPVAASHVAAPLSHSPAGEVQVTPTHMSAFHRDGDLISITQCSCYGMCPTLHAPHGQQRGTAPPPPVQTPAWQEPALQGVPSGCSAAAPHSPVEGSHLLVSLSHSPSSGQVTPMHMSAFDRDKVEWHKSMRPNGTSQ